MRLSLVSFMHINLFLILFFFLDRKLEGVLIQYVENVFTKQLEESMQLRYETFIFTGLITFCFMYMLVVCRSSIIIDH